jgi:hypothetical protein
LGYAEKEQFAAKLLGWNSYEKLFYYHKIEYLINEGLYVAECPLQGDRLTIKSRNIIVVFDIVDNAILFSVLDNYKQYTYVTKKNAHTVIDFIPVENQENSIVTFSEKLGRKILSIDNGKRSICFERTDKGICCFTRCEVKSNNISYIIINKQDANEFDCVDQASVLIKLLLGQAVGNIVYYKWKKTCFDLPYGDGINCKQPLHTQLTDKVFYDYSSAYFAVFQEKVMDLDTTESTSERDAYIGKFNVYPSDTKHMRIVRITESPTSHCLSRIEEFT